MKSFLKLLAYELQIYLCLHIFKSVSDTIAKGRKVPNKDVRNGLM